MASPAAAITQVCGPVPDSWYPAGDQHQGDHAHRLLAVRGAVGQRDHRPGDGLRPPEPARRRFLVGVPEQPVDEEDGKPGRQAGDQRRDDAGSRILDTTTEKLTPDTPAPTSTAPIRPPNSACEELDGSPNSQVVQIPQDRGHQPGEDHRRGDEGVVDHAAGDGLGDLGRQERADHVQHGGDQHGRPRPQRTGGDRGGHRVGAVVKTVGEIEEQRRQDDDGHQEQRWSSSDTGR